jgi:hypothetical protein
VTTGLDQAHCISPPEGEPPNLDSRVCRGRFFVAADLRISYLLMIRRFPASAIEDTVRGAVTPVGWYLQDPC